MRLKLIAIAATAVFASGAAFAGPSPQSSTFDVTANVPASCVIVAADTLPFGNYDPVDANDTAYAETKGGISVRCTRGTQAIVTLNEGLNAASGSTCAAPARQMRDPEARVDSPLRYDVYQEGDLSRPWGCSKANAQIFTSASSLQLTHLTAYGRIPGGQDVVAGSYIDTVTVDVIF